MMGEYESMNDAISEARKLKQNQYTTTFRNLMDVEMWIAMAYMIAGDEEKAIEALEAADEKSGPYFFNRELQVWFIFDQLRGNPRFDALLE
jgi:tetratricopeptide (TPR) repeat protein